jgi:uracil-DNA glycosylase family 4
VSDALDVLRQTIRQCRACEIAGLLDRAAPVVREERGDILVIGQAPGKQSSLHAATGTSPYGRTFRRWWEAAGLDADLWMGRCQFAALTRCFPGVASTGVGDRAPSRRERDLCRHWLDQEMLLARPRVVITLGRLAAADVLGVRGPMTAWIGEPHMISIGPDTVPAIPLPHPSGVSRLMNDPTNRERVSAGLRRIVAAYEGPRIDLMDSSF